MRETKGRKEQKKWGLGIKLCNVWIPNGWRRAFLLPFAFVM